MWQNDIRVFWQELLRRRVARVAFIYGAASWVLIQVADIFLQAFELDPLLKYVIAALLGGLPVALVLSWRFDLTPEGLERTPPAVPEDDGVPSIAVLPFENFSDDAGNEYFSDGLSEEIRDRLARVPGLRIAARTSSFAFKGKHQDAREIGRLLDVRLLLEGGVRKQGDTVRISAQLVDVSRGFQIWSETFERKLEDVFQIQSEISRAILEAVHVRLLDQHVGRQPTTDFEAYNLYLLGRHHFHRRSESSLNRAIDYFTQAIARDSRFALAYSGLADAASLLSIGYYGNLSAEQSVARALPAAEKALAINPDSAEAHASRGLIHHTRGELDASVESLERAIDLDPGYTLAHVWLGMTLISQGRYREAALRNTEALRLDPLSAIANSNAGFDAIRFGDDAAAETCFSHAMELDPSFPVPYSGMARLKGRRGDIDEALTWIGRAVERAPSRTYYLARKGFLYLQLGQFARAGEWLDAAGGHSTDNRMISDVVLALAIAEHDESRLASIAGGDAPFDAPQRGLCAWILGDDRAALRHLAPAPDHGTLIHDVINDTWLWRFPYSLYRACVRLRSGDPAAAADLEDLLRQLEATRQVGVVNAELRYWTGAALAALDRREAAIAVLETAVEEGWRNAWWARRDPSLAALAGVPAFATLIARVDGLIARSAETNRRAEPRGTA